MVEGRLRLLKLNSLYGAHSIDTPVKGCNLANARRFRTGDEERLSEVKAVILTYFNRAKDQWFIDDAD
jgi:hypothetical protein